jgi:inosine/xanthosine triphosphate pyrophosphatase family protein
LFHLFFLFGTVAGRATSRADGKRGRDYVLHVFVVFFYSYAEMETKQKNAISHRARALEKLRAYLQQAQQGVASASA